MDASVMLVIPWMDAFTDLVALETLSTELGEVNTHIYMPSSHSKHWLKFFG